MGETKKKSIVYNYTFSGKLNFYAHELIINNKDGPSQVLSEWNMPIGWVQSRSKHVWEDTQEIDNWLHVRRETKNLKQEGDLHFSLYTLFYGCNYLLVLI